MSEHILQRTGEKRKGEKLRFTFGAAALFYKFSVKVTK